MATRHTTDKHYLVRCGEGEVFLGRALDEPHQASLVLEGRSFHVVHASRGAGFAGTPFPTCVEFTLFGGPTLHALAAPEAVDEAEEALSEPCVLVEATRFPLLARWFAVALLGAQANAQPSAGRDEPPGVDSFEQTAEGFRRALLRSPGASCARELDRLTELEGDLVIELGKVANEVGLELTSLAQSDGELGRFLEQLGDPAATASRARGAAFLSTRLHGAVVFARERGRTALVRELGALIKDLSSRLGEVALEHEHALDVLISETLASRGCAPDRRDEVAPAGVLRKPRAPLREQPAPFSSRSST